ncbi:MAG: hypothetical protein K2M46_12115 [Lachnospiraceae bacterium]|nr:hypothetical protein [Lachnospiraceae bacterium]
MVRRQFISDSGYIGSFNLRLFSQAAMSVIGMVLAIRWFLELKKQKKCSGCKECKKMVPFGFLYGADGYAVFSDIRHSVLMKCPALNINTF